MQVRGSIIGMLRRWAERGRESAAIEPRDAPDADLQSNQELAALYLARQQTPPAAAAPPEEEQPVADATLAQILQGLQLQTGGAAPPP